MTSIVSDLLRLGKYKFEIYCPGLLILPFSKIETQAKAIVFWYLFESFMNRVRLGCRLLMEGLSRAGKLLCVSIYFMLISQHDIGRHTLCLLCEHLRGTVSPRCSLVCHCPHQSCPRHCSLGSQLTRSFSFVNLIH